MNEKEFIGKIKDAFDAFKNETSDGGVGSGRPKSGLSRGRKTGSLKGSASAKRSSRPSYRSLKSFR